MKSTITRRQYKAIYRLLNRVSPVDYDCGTLCNAACCSVNTDNQTEEETEYGMYLLPGEDKLFTKNESWLGWSSCRAQDWEFPDSWHGKVYFLSCKANCHCDRAMRPIQCRTFPLAPHYDDEGRLCLIYDPMEVPYSCPLITKKIPLNQRFIRATYTVWKHLTEEPLIRDLVEMDSDYRIEDEVEIETVYTGE